MIFELIKLFFFFLFLYLFPSYKTRAKSKFLKNLNKINKIFETPSRKMCSPSDDKQMYMPILSSLKNLQFQRKKQYSVSKQYAELSKMISSKNIFGNQRHDNCRPCHIIPIKSKKPTATYNLSPLLKNTSIIKNFFDCAWNRAHFFSPRDVPILTPNFWFPML